MKDRIHGEYILKRRDNLKEMKYPQYLSYLREDFKFICAYCGKPEELATKGFEIDHFVPRTLDKSKEDEYTNLVYSCFTCNRKKGSKWPTRLTDLPNDGEKGFIDPTTVQFDDALYRMEDGTIHWKNEVGKYMAKFAFKFDKRPIAEIYRATKLINYKKKLSELLDTNPNLEDFEKYKKLDLDLQEICSYLFGKKE